MQINKRSACEQILIFMKKVATVWRGLLCAAAMGITLLLAPGIASASKHDPDNRAYVAGCGSMPHQEVIGPVESEVAIPAGEHRLHCHLLSTPAMAVGKTQSRDDVNAVAPARVELVILARHESACSPPASPIPIAAPPPHILFGNFRS